LDKKDKDRVLILIVGIKLSVKLSYLNGSLKGTETYYEVPHDEYWIENYGVLPKVIEAYGDVSFVAPNGYFLLWQREGFNATEMVGKNPDHAPPEVYSWQHLKSLKHLDSIGGIEKGDL